MKPKKTYKILIPIASLALIVSCLPSLVSTKIGTKAIIALVNRFSSGKIAVSDLSLSWLGSQKIQQLQYEELGKGMILTCEEIIVEMSFLNALFLSKNFDSIQIIRPKLLVTSNFLSASQSIQTPQKQASFLPTAGSIEIVKENLSKYEGSITLKEGSLEVKIPGIPNIVFAAIEAAITLNSKEQASSFSLQIKTLEGETNGHLSLKGSLDKNLSIEASSSHFPLEGADQILKLLGPKYEGTLVAILGPSLDMNCSIRGYDNLFDAKLNLQSQNIKVGLQMSSREKSVDLVSPAFLNVSLTPDSNKKLSFLFPDVPLITKTSPIFLVFNIDSLHIPIQEGNLSIEDSSFISSISSLPYSISPEINANIKGNLSSDLLKEKVVAELNLELNAQKNASRVSILANLIRPLEELPSIEGNLTTEKIPTSLLNGFFSFPPSDFLGPWVEAKSNIKGTLHSANFSLQIAAPLTSLSDASFRWENKELTLLAPAAITYQLQPALVENTISHEIHLKEPATSIININELIFSKNLYLKSKISIPPLKFNKLFSLENYSLPSLQVDITTNTLDQIHVHAKSDIFSLDSKLKLDENKLTLTAPLEVIFIVNKQDVLLANLPFTLLDEAKATLTFNPTSLSLEGDLKKSKLEAKLEVTPLHMKNKENGNELTIQKVTSDIIFSGPKEQVDFSFQMDFADVKIQNSLNGSGSLQKVLSNTDFEFFNFTVVANHLSLALIEDFYVLPFPLSPLIGDTITASLKVEKNLTLESFALQAETPVLKVKGSLAREKDKLFFPKNSTPFQIEYTLIPAAYKALCPTSPFALKEKSVFSTSITDLNIPFFPNSSLPDLTGMKISALTSNEQTIFQRQGSSEAFTLRSSKISLEKKAFQKDLTLNIDTKAKASELNEGELHLDLVLSKFLNEQGNFTLSDLHMAIQAKASQFPSTALDIAFALKKEPLTLVLGPSFEATLNMTLQNATGPLSFDLRSNKAHIDFVGKMELGTLKLAKDLKADLLLTHELGKFLLQETNVSSIKSFYSPAPLTIMVASKGFSFPVGSMDFSQIQVPFMRIDFGKLYCKNEGAIVNLLRQLRSNEPEGKEIQIWVAPMDLHITSGIVDIERTEILLDKSYDVAIWGQVDLPNNYVDMAFGLTAAALQQAFGIADLSQNYVIKIPIKGPLNDVKIKTSSATSKITALLLWKSNALDSVVPFGGILKKVVPPPGDGKAPAAKTPFPWHVSR